MLTWEATAHGCVLDCNPATGAGTDDTVALQAAINALSAHYVSTGELTTLHLTGVAKVSSVNCQNNGVYWSAAVVLKSGVRLACDALAGIYLAPYSDCTALSTDMEDWPAENVLIFNRNQNCGIDGGTVYCGTQHKWEQNLADDASGRLHMWNMGIWFGQGRGIFIRNTRVDNSASYGINISTVIGVELTNVAVTWPGFVLGNQDTIHFYGTVEQCNINGLSSNYISDDMFALNCTESSYQAPAGQFRRVPRQGGHLKDFYIGGGRALTTTQFSFRLGDVYNFNPSENWLDNITIDDFVGDIGAHPCWVQPPAVMKRLAVSRWNATGNNSIGTLSTPWINPGDPPHRITATRLVLNDIGNSAPVYLGAVGQVLGNMFDAAGNYLPGGNGANGTIDSPADNTAANIVLTGEVAGGCTVTLVSGATPAGPVVYARRYDFADAPLLAGSGYFWQMPVLLPASSNNVVVNFSNGVRTASVSKIINTTSAPGMPATPSSRRPAIRVLEGGVWKAATLRFFSGTSWS